MTQMQKEGMTKARTAKKQRAKFEEDSVRDKKLATVT